MIFVDDYNTLINGYKLYEQPIFAPQALFERVGRRPK